MTKRQPRRKPAAARPAAAPAPPSAPPAATPAAGGLTIAHVADLHLGFRQHHRLTAHGINQREADVALAFRRVIDDVISTRPDVMLVAGDLFHSVRPANPAILDAFNQLRRFRDALPATPVVIVAGDHDTPRSMETGTILKLFEAIPDIWVVVNEAKRLSFDALGLSVLAVPWAAVGTDPRPSFVPETDARHNVLLLHGELAGLPREYDPEEYGTPTLELSELHPDKWNYVALGHYHVARQMAPTVWYAGSMEYVSRNPWGDLKQEGELGRAGQKGWLLVRLGARPHVEFRPIPLARRLIDLPPIAGAGLDAPALSQEVADQVKKVKGGIDGQIVRQLAYDVPRLVARDVNHEAIRGYKARALHFHLDLRRPESRRAVGVGGSGGGRARTLGDIVTEYLEQRVLTPGVERGRLVSLGSHYMDQAEREPGLGVG